MLILRGTGGGLSVMCAILGCAAQVCMLAAVLCGSPATVCPYPMSTAGGLFLWVLWRGEKSKNKSISSYSLIFLLCSALLLADTLVARADTNHHSEIHIVSPRPPPPPTVHV